MKKEICLILKITYRCNDECSFCIAHEQRGAHIPDLSFADIKKNFEFFSKKFNISRVNISGGEPTLHSEFFDILKYLKKKGPIVVNLVTNAIIFENKKFLRDMILSFPDASANEDNSVVFSFNDYPPASRQRRDIVKKRIRGIINLMKSELPLECVITISKNNCGFLSEITRHLIDFKNKHNSNLRGVEFRMLYIKFTSDLLLEETLPDSFDEIKLSIEKAIEYLKQNGTRYYFWNLPLCYLDNPVSRKNIWVKEFIKGKMMMPEVLIDAEHQYGDFIPIDFQKYLKGHSECGKCSLKDYCGGIDSAYLDLHNYPDLKTIN